MTKNLTLVAIFAHPDDEAFGTGGTLAKYAHEGVDVHLITATLGEAGRIATTDITLDHPMSVLREKELRCACENYGIKELHLLGYTDGQTTVVPQNEAVFKIVKLLRKIKPEVVISFGPDGIYGHYDHLAVHRWATASIQLAGDGTWWPKAGPVHNVAKFYHRAIPKDQVEHMEKDFGRGYVPMDDVPFPFFGYPIEQITTIIDVEPYLEFKRKGIRCHTSQLAPDNPYSQEDFDMSSIPWFLKETYILAYCHPDIAPLLPTDQKEDDLFTGLR